MDKVLNDQTNIFQESEWGGKQDFLLVVKDSQEQKMSTAEIFDAKKYDEFYAITYVSSPNFFMETIKGFDKVSIILGIDDAGVLEDFAKGLALKEFLNIENRVEFWNELDLESRKKIQTGKLDIRYGSIKHVIHDKIYLLRNQKTKAIRVITGSANLTKSAFDNKGQYENLRIDDQREDLFRIYEKRFAEIHGLSMDYIPAQCKADKDIEKIYYVKDGEIAKDILIDELEKYDGKIIIEEQHIEQVKDLASGLRYKKEEVDQTDKVLNLITKKRMGKYQIKSKRELDKKAIALKTAFCRTNQESTEIDDRPTFIHNPKDYSLMKGTKGAHELDKSYSRPIETEKLKVSLEKINKFIEAYLLFAENPSVKNQSKVFEMILFTFVSPFIWKIRDDYVLQKGREGARADFPPFMIIGGVAKSGKTTALEFCSLLMGNNGKRYFEYAKEVAKAGVLFDYFNTENTFPILVDEVEPSFFHRSNSPMKGEALIKYVSNSLKRNYPALIGTTNLRDFSTNSQIIRRIYYLEINNVFSEELKYDSDQYLNEIIADIDDHLFRDFTYRFTAAINEKEAYYQPGDILYRARELFKSYYREAGISVPEWFPHKPFNDYHLRKTVVWKNLYFAHEEFFEENHKGTLYVRIDDIFKNSKSRKDRENAINFLDETCIIENNAVLELNKERFFDFIEYSPRKTIVERVKSYFQG